MGYGSGREAGKGERGERRSPQGLLAGRNGRAGNDELVFTALLADVVRPTNLAT